MADSSIRNLTAAAGAHLTAPLFAAQATAQSVARKWTAAQIGTELIANGGVASKAANTFTEVQTLPDGSADSPSLLLTDAGLYRFSAGVLGISAGGVFAAAFAAGSSSFVGSVGASTYFEVAGGSADGFYATSQTGSFYAGTSYDTILTRDAAGVWGIRNAANAMGLNIYRTYTDGSNYERQAFSSAAGLFRWSAETAGTGTDDIDLRLAPAGTGIVEAEGPFNGDIGQVTESTTSRTLGLADRGKDIRCTNGSTTTITVPTNAAIAYRIGTQIVITRAGAGTVTIVGDGGVTVNSPAAANDITVQYGQATLTKVGTDEWDLEGRLA